MSASTFPDDLRSRFRWAIRESGLIAGIFLVWILFGVIYQLAVFVIAFIIQTLQIDQLRFVFEVFERSDAIWALVVPLATTTAALYVLVRAGTILIDRYQSSD